MSIWFKAGGVGFIVVGLMALVGGFVSDSAMRLGLLITGVVFVVVGFIFLAVGGFIKGLDPDTILKAGTKPGEVPGEAIPATAQVASTRDTGVILNNVNLVIEVGLMVYAPGKPPYQVSTRHVMQGRNQWGALQPGMTVPVLINPNDPSKVVIDTNRPFVSSAGAPTSAQVVTKSAADLVNAGTKTTAVLEQVAPTGMTAGQAKPGLPQDQADDPIMQVAFSYTDATATSHRSEILVRVPDGKSHALQQGATIPIAYLPDNPASATIDWDAVPPLQV
jgi:hypothetical protein